ncbi:MAG: hypothetical protein H6811_06860 [Phycisphaeraceae bacterium]|nr:hypothetical protein [Phycisphaeraceae bacterium]
MSSLTNEQFDRMLTAAAKHPAMREENLRLREGSGLALAGVFLSIGALGLVFTIAGAFVLNARHALAAFEVGLFTVTALSLGGLFWTMVLHLTNAGWSATVRRQLENLMMMLPWCLVGALIVLILEIANGGIMLSWLGIDPHTDHLLEHKSPYLNPGFLVIRFVIYAVVWMFLATSFWRWSKAQDQTGDRWLTAKARRLSAPGLILFALTTAFFAFDFLMGTDHRFFSTMWGVYYFASAALGGMAALMIITSVLRGMGYLTGLVTSEHAHDVGKLVFGFTVFWAYITFSQYFLIWYSNIPEESAWFVNRSQDGWQNLGAVLILGHFIVPFLVLLFRDVKRNPIGASIAAGWLILMIIADMVWILRPMVYLGDLKAQNPGPAGWWLDIAGIAAAVGLWGGLLIHRIRSGVLVPLKDPRLGEALKHQNWV